VLAESGALDGKAATAHWGDIDRLQRVYPRVDWQRGVRYVDGGTLLSTAGLTAGVDATLHLLRRRHGTELAARVAEALHVPASPFVENPKCRQFEIGRADAIFLLNAGFHWPKPRLNVWLYDGVGELDLGSAADVYGVSAAYQIHTQSTAASVTLHTLWLWHRHPDWRTALDISGFQSNCSGDSLTSDDERLFCFEDPGWDPEFQKWQRYSESIRKQFEQKLTAYEKRVRTLVESRGAIRAHGRFSAVNFEWFVLYQLANMSATKILRKSTRLRGDESTILKGVKIAATLLGWTYLVLLSFADDAVVRMPVGGVLVWVLLADKVRVVPSIPRVAA
jgi:hypothetical protein